MVDIPSSNSELAPKRKRPNKEEIIEALRKLRRTDKYHNLHKIIPGVVHTPDEVQDIISNIIDDCCTELVRNYLAKKRPTVSTVRSIILKYMDLISYADVNTENKDFGYELCWYIAEKTDVSLKKYTSTKVYGYWNVQDNQLKTVTKRGKRTNKKQ